MSEAVVAYPGCAIAFVCDATSRLPHCAKFSESVNSVGSWPLYAFWGVFAHFFPPLPMCAEGQLSGICAEFRGRHESIWMPIAAEDFSDGGLFSCPLIASGLRGTQYFLAENTYFYFDKIRVNP